MDNEDVKREYSPFSDFCIINAASSYPTLL